jgi:AraC family transcriptional regulator of adaptative response/methylated-DNA-[protein]-cysteine methyltransferase
MKELDRHRDYERVEEALDFLGRNRDIRPDLEAVASHVGLSPHHFQRLFSRWAGISPKRFLQYLTVEHARRCLAETRSVLETSLEVGLSSPSRLHDLMVTIDAVTPGEFRRGGEGLRIRFGRGSSPFGTCLIGVTERGVCWLSFSAGSVREAAAEIGSHFYAAELVEDAAEAKRWRDRIFPPTAGGGGAALPVLLSGTNFQLKVWEALLRVPPAGLVSYSDLAAVMGRPSATRAVASAVAANHLAYLIPCHRVIRAMGEAGRYRWGAVRKRAMIGWERAWWVGGRADTAERSSTLEQL